MDNAQLYLSLVRPSLIPIVGESADDLFKGQIEVTGWKWNFHNEDEQNASEDRKKRLDTMTKRRRTTRQGDKLTKELELLKAQQAKASSELKGTKTTEDAKKLAEESMKELQASISGLAKMSERDYRLQRQREDQEEDKRQREDEEQQKTIRQLQGRIDDEEGKENFQFTFTKRIDFASTQMLNSLKAGDKFPVAIFTMHQYSSNNPMSLVIKFEGLRLLEYGVKVDATDTMTDLKEEWKCDFEAMSYVYQNRRSMAKPKLGSVADAKQIAAKAATQGTVRQFAMKNTKLGI